VKIEGSIRSSLLSADSSARRWRGVGPSTRIGSIIGGGVPEHGRSVGAGPLNEPVAERIANLEIELPSVRVG